MTGLPIRKACAMLAALLLTACAGAGPYHAPALPLAPAWTAANATPRAPAAEWWRDLGDPALDRLVAAGLSDNSDIAVALARLDQARAAAQVSGAARLPAAQASASVARQRQSLDSGLGQLTRYVPTLSRTQNQGEIGVGASWDIDFAGALAGQERAAKADAVAAQAAFAATRLATTAEIAQSWLAWRSARADRALLGTQRDLIAQQLRIAEAQVARGDSGRGELDRARAVLAQIDAALPDFDTAIASAHHRLAILTGRPAGAALPELDGLRATGAWPDPGDPAAGTPADVLRLRPDIVVAEARLRASHARISTALGEYWPKFSLSGMFGFSSNDLSLLGSGSANVITGAAGLRWRLFDFGRIDGEVAAARGAEREALAAYRGTVLAAGGDVEDAFVALVDARRTLAARLTADAAQAALLSHADAAARAGEISQADLIGAHVKRIDAARAVLAARVRLTGALIACHRALGG